MILVAVTLGRWIEAEGKQRATKSLATLQNLLPTTARVVTNDDVIDTPLEQVAVGEEIRVLPGERIPLDGIVSNGRSFVDTRLVTGESEPQSVGPNDVVFGGVANIDGTLLVEVTTTADTGVIQRLLKAVKSAAEQTSRPERLADRLATILAALIVVIATIVFVTHFRGGGMQPALMASMAVVLIACPCALAVATPLAIWSALSAAARRGVVFRTSDDLLRLGRVSHVCFDKTGTITTGDPRLDSFHVEDNSMGDLRKLFDMTHAMCAHSVHPLAKATLQFLETDDIPSKLPASEARMRAQLSCRIFAAYRGRA